MGGLFEKMKRHYHFIGIGGVGMGTIASLLAAQGHKVSGSDLKESEFTAKLREQGAAVFIGHAAKNVAKPDTVVYSSAIAKNNPELIAAKRKRIKIVQRAQLLAELMKAKEGITIAGAHGKTTTTSMISCLLIKAGLNPTTAVGGIVNGGSYGANLGDGKHFVAEVDESDGSFLYFSPKYSVITNMDFEHVDYYKNWKNILSAYRKFIKKTVFQGCLFICGEDQQLRQLAVESKRKFLSYGFSSTNSVVARNLATEGYFSRFECSYQGKDLGVFRLKVPGKHNILNALACISVGMELSVDPDVIKKSLEEFTGAKRRFQLKGEVGGVKIVDDYGHHPSEIVATLEAAKSFKQNRVVVVFQPHRFSRTKFLMDDFVTSLSVCDYLVLTDIYAASEKPIEGVSSQILYEKIKKTGRVPVIYLKKDEIIGHLSDIIQKGDLVLTLGAGDVTKLSDELVLALQGAKRFSAGNLMKESV